LKKEWASVWIVFVHLSVVLDRIIKELGKGGFGYIYLAVRINKGEGTFVLKCIDKPSSDVCLEKERDIGYSSRLNSKYLVKYYEIFKWNKLIFIVMPYYAEGSLSKYITKHIDRGKKISKIVCFSIF
jgi:serine/threonine protein kinase